MSPKGCGKIYNTIIRSQRQIKRFRTLNPAEDLGSKFYCYHKKGSISKATQHKALAALVGGWPGNLINGREVGALGPGKNSWWRTGVGAAYSFFYPRLQKAEREKSGCIRCKMEQLAG